MRASQSFISKVSCVIFLFAAPSIWGAGKNSFDISLGLTYSFGEDLGQQYKVGGLTLGGGYTYKLKSNFFLYGQLESQSWMVQEKTISGFDLEIGTYHYLVIVGRGYWQWHKSWASGLGGGLRYLYGDPVGGYKPISYIISWVPARYRNGRYAFELDFQFLHNFDNFSALPLILRGSYAF